MSARGLPGSRVDAYRAGITTMYDIKTPLAFVKPLVGTQCPCFRAEHYRYPFPDRKGHCIQIADQLGALVIEFEVSLADGTRQQGDQFLVHAISLDDFRTLYSPPPEKPRKTLLAVAPQLPAPRHYQAQSRGI